MREFLIVLCLAVLVPGSLAAIAYFIKESLR